MSPGPMMARTRWDSPSLAPMVAIASVSGSSSTLYFRLYQLQMARRSFGIPHSEIDDVLARLAHLRLQVRHDGQNVRGEPLDPWELFHGRSPGKYKQDMLMNLAG